MLHPTFVLVGQKVRIMPVNPNELNEEALDTYNTAWKQLAALGIVGGETGVIVQIPQHGIPRYQWVIFDKCPGVTFQLPEFMLENANPYDTLGL